MTHSFVGESKWGRSFNYGWQPKREGVLKLAARLKAMAVAMEDIKPGLGQLWLQFERRGMRPDDPGSLLYSPVEDLARLLDRRGRADPPRFPAPVGRNGYRVAIGSLGGEVIGNGYGANVWADKLNWPFLVPVELSMDQDSPIWLNAGTSRRILLALIDAWDPEWATVGTSMLLGLDERGALMSRKRPWMAWAAAGHVVPQESVEDAGAPLDVQAVRDGVMSTWPWPPPPR